MRSLKLYIKLRVYLKLKSGFLLFWKVHHRRSKGKPDAHTSQTDGHPRLSDILVRCNICPHTSSISIGMQ